MIRQVFEEFYRKCVSLEERHLSEASGLRVELGAGTSLFKKFYPDVISTDIEPAPHLDRVVDAQKMPFEDGSVRTLFCINCFHHFPDPSLFFREALRVLAPGGGCIIIDPAYGWLSNFLYKRLFSAEGYDKGSPDWTYLKSADGALLPNQALSFLVFFRDFKKFHEKFPELDVPERGVMGNYLRYLLSGGLNFRQLVPNFTIPLVRGLESCLMPFQEALGLHHYVVLKKNRR